MSLSGNWNGDTYYADLWAEGNFAYEGHTRTQLGVDIIDISNPANPILAANFKGAFDNNLRDIFVKNGIGYFCSNATTKGGVYVVDVHDGYHPNQLAFIPTSAGGETSLHSIYVDGNYLYETTGSSPDIPIFDVSNPANPVFLRKVVDPNSAGTHEVTVKNGRMYVASLNNIGYVDIYDVTNVANTSVPVPLLGQFIAGGGAHTAWPTDDGNYLAVTHEATAGTITIFDIHNPANAFYVASVPPLPTDQAASVHQVMIIGNLMYVSWYQAGVYVYDVSVPTDPVLVGSYDTYPSPPTGSFQGAWGVYGYFGPGELLASDMSTGLYILGIPNISIQGQVFQDTNGNGIQDAGELGVSGRTVFLDSNNNGVLDPGEPSTVTDANGNYSFTNLPPAAYRVREVLPSSWTQTTVNPPAVSAANGIGVTGLNFGTFQSSILGTVFNDLNGNGSRDTGEPGLAAATVFLDLNHDGRLDTNTTTLNPTDTPQPIPDVGPASSTIVASGLVGAVTHVSVTLNIAHTFDSDLIITLLGPGEQRIVLVNRRGGSGQNFTNTVFDDSAANPISSGSAPFTGTYQPETPLAVLIGSNPNGAWTLQVQDMALNDAGTIQSWSLSLTTTEPSTTTDANGNYVFAGLPVGTYTVRAAPGASAMQTTANPPATTISTSGTAAAGGTFGEFLLVTLSGNVFGDANSNGVQDGSETGLAGRTVFNDANGNGVLDPGELHTTTDAFGNFSFANRGPFTFTIRAVVPAGWMQTTGNPMSFKPTSGGNVSGLSFGAFQFGQISGNVFNDLNGNGTKDNGEPGLAGWTVFLDQNNDGVQDQNTTTLGSTDTPKPLPDFTTTTSNLLVTGLAGPIAKITVTLNIAHTFDSDLIISLISPTGAKVLLVNRRGGSGQNFIGTVLDDQATLSIASGTAPFTGSYRPEQLLSALNGLSANGVWTLQVSDVIRNNSGTLNSWSLTITTNEPSVTTDANGNYSFKNLSLGSYTVREVLQTGWTQTSTNPAPIVVNVSGTSVTQINFGDQQAMAAAAAKAPSPDPAPSSSTGPSGAASILLALQRQQALDPGLIDLALTGVEEL
jgi:subtilisin-like proprotein convertase family protein